MIRSGRNNYALLATLLETALNHGKDHDADQRLIDLEMKFAHQESTIEALQQSVYEQQKEIWQLQERLKRHLERFEDIVANRVESNLAHDERPPHY